MYKTRINRIVFILCTTIVFTFSSCSDDDEDKTINDRDQFLGNYSVVYCSFNYTYENIISAVDTHENRITFSDYANEDSLEQPYAIVSGSTINIPSQTYESGAGPITTQGSGFISGNTLTITYTIGSTSCTDVYTKQ